MVEIIVVIAIIAILMAVVGSKYASTRRSAANERTSAHMEQVLVAIGRARDERQQPLSSIVGTDGHAACSGLQPVPEVSALGGACRAAWDDAARSLAPWLGSEEAAREVLTDGSGRPIVVRFGERGCAGNDALVAPDPKEYGWGAEQRSSLVDTSRYSC